MKNILRMLKQIWFLNFLRRIFYATKYYNGKYIQILKWGINSREDTNYTYDLSEANIIVMAHTVSVVTKIDYKLILQYINEARNDHSLKEEIVKTIKSSTLNRYSDSKVYFGRRLGWYAFTRALKPKIIIETGIDKGLGSVLLCSAIERNREEGFDGKYFGTDINPNAGYLFTDKYKDIGEILYGDSIKSLSRFTEKIDLFINDSDHSTDYEYQEYLTVKNFLSDKAIILSDNSHFSDKLTVFSNENDRSFLFFREVPKNHWYPGAGIGISF